MAIEFKLPAVAEGIESVDIAEILVAEGDRIEAGAIICEVETDKSVAEVDSPHGGTIAKILVATGQSVPVGTPLVLIETATQSAEVPEAASEPSATDSSGSDVTPPSKSDPAPPAAAASANGEKYEVEFSLPEVAEGVASVDIAEVLVSVGDVIEAGTVICEAETDKSVAEIDCPDAGTIRAIHVAVGQTVNVGEPLVTIEITSAPEATTPSAVPPATTEASATPPVLAASNAVPSATSVATGGSSDRQPPAPAGPATRRMARKLGVDLYQVEGSAKGGRIVIEDIEGFVRNRLAQPAAPAGGSASVGVVAAAPLPDFSKFGPIEKLPLNRISRTAAANLHAAWITIPHVTQHNLADITELESARKRYVKDNPKSPKITMTAIMIKAVVGALRTFPKVNSSIDPASGELVLKKYYHIGVAVDTPNGLVVPVIRNCDQKNVLQVATELTELASKARERKLTSDDMQGASFTITNLGGIGGTSFTPIVNHPEVAILGMSRGQKVLQMEEGKIVERMMLPLSMSYDHRAINGADAARFIVKLSGSLTNFFELF
ncbi:MAG: pyruvate dehydrogenase [Fuerstiella sp.]|nr:pyruvate dehydrogenase [Fuerstiella sp.]MCP4859325.1 pyruvate dehydrogenase [Fuerstiella sp.]